MKNYSLTVVVPTQGRITLDRCLESMSPKNQGGHFIDINVVEDPTGIRSVGNMDTDEIQDMCFGRATYYKYNSIINDYGYPQIWYGYQQAETEYIMNLGDDDVMIEGVYEKIHEVINSRTMHPLLFQVRLHPSPTRGNRVPVILWNDQDRSITRGKITSQNMLVPNIPQLMGNMWDDYEFIRSTIEKWHGTVTWVPTVIADCY